MKKVLSCCSVLLICLLWVGCSSSSKNGNTMAVADINSFLQNNKWVYYDKPSQMEYTVSFYEHDIVTLEKHRANTPIKILYSGTYLEQGDSLQLTLTLNPDQPLSKEISSPDKYNSTIKITPAQTAAEIVISSGDNFIDGVEIGQQIQFTPPLNTDYGVYLEGHANVTQGMNGTVTNIVPNDTFMGLHVIVAETHYRQLDDGEIEAESTRAYFNGQITLSGTLTLVENKNDTSKYVALFKLDDASSKKVPLAVGATEPVSIQLLNSDEVQKATGIAMGTEKTVALVLDNYTTNYSLNGLPHTAYFLSIQ